MIMKTKLLSFASLFMVISCADPLSDDSLSEYELQIQALEVIESGCLQFYDNQYHLDVDCRDVINLGYSSKVYEVLVKFVEDTNNALLAHIEKWESDPTITEVKISEVPYKKKSDPYIVKSEACVINGVIETYDQTPQEGYYMLPPVFAPTITANCFGRNAPLGVNIVATKQGSIIDTKIIPGSGEVELNINLTNTVLVIIYQNTATGGGICSLHLNIKDSQIYL